MQASFSTSIPRREAVKIEPEKLSVKVNDDDSVTALLYQPAKPKRLGATLILGHGAGGNQLSGFMKLYASALAERGLDVLTFNFQYSEKGKGVPDPGPKLESCYRAIIESASRHKKLNSNKLFIGGKSMGGRIASQVAAQDSSGLAGLVFLGYPLHPPGRPDKMRDAHLKDVKVPMLFVQGSRDAFGSPEELRAVIQRLHLNATLHLIESGDHSFKAPKSVGAQDEIHDSVMNLIVQWIADVK